MAFDINEVLSQMLSAAKDSLKEDWEFAKGVAVDFMESRKARFELLANLRIENQISEVFFEDRLKDEKDIFESELHAVAIISKVTAQNAANAAISVFENAVKAFLGI